VGFNAEPRSRCGSTNVQLHLERNSSQLEILYLPSI
jgi:hypothetical protein